MTRPRIVVPRGLPEAWMTPLHAAADVVAGPQDAVSLSRAVEAALPSADGVLTLLTQKVDAAFLDRAPRLRVVSNMAVGVDNIDLEACAQRGVAVGHTPGVLTDATADLTMALLLSAARRLPAATADAAAGRWGPWSPTGWLGLELGGATLGIVGPGKIGTAVARRAAAFGMEILYAHHRAVPPIVPDAQGVSLNALLERADVVSLHVPLTEATRGLIDASALGRMKSTALLVNTARGPIVDTDALVQALGQGELGGAALDVTDPEPLPPSHPLYALPNVVIAPHIGSATHRTRARMASVAIDNVLAGVRGAPLPHAVD
ncbi:MAG: 2-hydroxyacid dehydrogenase [Nannocystaceae bacterium]|nr:D-glycerate dehydrogenase [bacterium]